MAARPSKAQKLIRAIDCDQDPSPASDPEPTTSSSCSMDPALWRFFPEDLMARVLSRMPLPPLFRFRCVCRLWNILSHSPSFASLHSSLMQPPQASRLSTKEQREAWILIFADRGYRVVSAYIPAENKWHHIPLSFLPFDISDVTVAGGLLVFRWHEPAGGGGGDAAAAGASSSVCVCNPVTREWRKLPPMLGGWRDGLLGVVVDEERGGKYKIVVRSNGGLNPGSNVGGVGGRQQQGRTTEVYDSERDGWVRTSGIDDGITTGHAYCNGVLYFMTWETRSGVYGVYAYHVEQGSWSKVHVPIPDFMTCPHVVECQGRLLMVGGFGRRPHFVTEGICVWELRPRTRDWGVVHNMPEALFKELLHNSSLLSFNCVGHGDQIFLSNRKSPRLVVIFDCAHNSWKRVESCISHDLHPMYSWFSYYPRLATVL